MNIDNINKKLMCVEYPGVVKNVDNMIATLGGINQISQTFSTHNRRLQLKFRPDNIYTKPCHGDKTRTTGLLLSIKVRRPKKTQHLASTSTAASQTKNEYHITVVGSVDSLYKFNSNCDFQYLPIHRNATTSQSECIYDKLMPKGLISSDWLTEETDVPYFLPPIIFCRFDSTQLSLFRSSTAAGAAAANKEDDGLIGKTRLRRHKHATYIQFSLTEEVPGKPHPKTADYLKIKLISTEEYNVVKELFDKRPIMSKMVISYESKLSNDRLKYILPALAYYYTTGPWRIMWCRYGYDPKKDFESRYYQQLDYRIRMHIGVKNHIDLKRYHNVQQLGYKNVTKNFSILTDEPEKIRKADIVYYPYFEEGRLPPSRQCIYQYCDIHVPKIQEMLDKIPTPLTGATCNEKSGWLPMGFDDQCRAILTVIIKEMVNRSDFEEDLMGADDETFEGDEEEEDDETGEVLPDDDFSDNDLD